MSAPSARAEHGSMTGGGSPSSHPAVTEQKKAPNGKEEKRKEDTVSTVMVASGEKTGGDPGLPTARTSMLSLWLYETRPGEMTFTEKLEQQNYGASWTPTRAATRRSSSE